MANSCHDKGQRFAFPQVRALLPRVGVTGFEPRTRRSVRPPHPGGIARTRADRPGRSSASAARELVSAVSSRLPELRTHAPTTGCLAECATATDGTDRARAAVAAGQESFGGNVGICLTRVSSSAISVGHTSALPYGKGTVTGSRRIFGSQKVSVTSSPLMTSAAPSGIRLNSSGSNTNS
jgi:hypothetical protein